MTETERNQVPDYSELKVAIVHYWLVGMRGGEQAVDSFKAQAESNITFLGEGPFRTLKHHMARCRAMISLKKEDFGIVPVEVMALGWPVIACGKGKAQDTLVERVSGVLVMFSCTSVTTG